MTSVPRGTPDPIDRAIAATQTPAPIAMARIPVKLGSGRPAVVEVPVDLAMDEAIGLIGWMATQLPELLETARNPSGLILPQGPRLVAG